MLGDVEVVHDDHVGEQVQRRSERKLPPKLDWLDLEHETDERHQQERPGCDNSAEV